MYLEDALCRFREHSVSSLSIGRSPMKVSTFCSLFLALTAKICLAEIIIETKKLDEDGIIKAAVSFSVFNFYSYCTQIVNPSSSDKDNSTNFIFLLEFFPVLAETKIYRLSEKIVRIKNLSEI